MINDNDLVSCFDDNDETLACGGDRSRLRWISGRDLNVLLAIERESFEFPWTFDEFKYCLNSRNCGGFIVERDGVPLGYLFYELRKRSVRLLSCAVAPAARRQGLGTKMTRKLISKLNDRRVQIVCTVRERNVPAQLFLRNLGFRAVWVKRNYYLETSEDAYRMTFRLDARPLSDDELRRRRMLSR